MLTGYSECNESSPMLSDSFDMFCVPLYWFCCAVAFCGLINDFSFGDPLRLLGYTHRELDTPESLHFPKGSPNPVTDGAG